MKYWAHSDPNLPETDSAAHWQPLNSHLVEVGGLAESFAREANPFDVVFQKLARAAGLLHDLGKYSREFQDRIRGLSHHPAPHSAHGAAIARREKAVEAAFAIAGHHAGLPDAIGLRSRTD